MRITSKGQVTIPVEIRERRGSCRILRSSLNATALPCALFVSTLMMLKAEEPALWLSFTIAATGH